MPGLVGGFGKIPLNIIRNIKFYTFWCQYVSRDQVPMVLQIQKTQNIHSSYSSQSDIFWLYFYLAKKVSNLNFITNTYLNLKTQDSKELNEREKIQKSDEDLNLLNLRLKLGAYLAGLIESDGTIAVHDKNSKAKRYNPKIAVVFNIADEPLAYKLLDITKVGTIFKKENAGHIL